MAENGKVAWAERSTSGPAPYEYIARRKARDDDPVQLPIRPDYKRQDNGKAALMSAMGRKLTRYESLTFDKVRRRPVFVKLQPPIAIESKPRTC